MLGGLTKWLDVGGFEMSFIMLSHSRFPRQDFGEIASAEKVFFYNYPVFPESAKL